MNYPEDHPLHGQTAEWIAEQASGRADWAIDNAARSLPRETVALAHEYRRLKAEVDHLPVGWLRAPLDWLTRAIETAGAPEGSDWAGLLEYMGPRGQDRYELIRERDKLRERAEAAESERDKLKSDKSKAISKARDLVNIYPITMVEAVDDLVNLLNVYLKSDSESRERANKAEAELESIHLRDTPTPPLDRIAADVSRIAAALEKRNEPLFADKSEPIVHTQHGGKFGA